MKEVIAISAIMVAATFGADSFCRVASASDEPAPSSGSHTATAAVQRIIARQYEVTLGRKPDPSGLATYTEALLNGGKDEKWLHEVLATSREARNRAEQERRALIIGALVISFVVLLIWLPWPARRAIALVSSLLDSAARWLPNMVPTSWKSFCLGLAFLFFFRGLFFLCLYPPLEGFDEHQHIAYLVHLEQTNDIPKFGEAMIPKSLYADLVSNPHSTYGWRQLRPVGALRYKDFWHHRAAPDYSAEVMMSSAFHPPLYYRLLSPLFSALAALWGFRDAVYGARIISVAFAALSIFFFLLPLKSFFGAERLSRLGFLAISLSPMYLVYSVRVSPDGLALLITSLVFFLLAGLPARRMRNRLVCCVLVGALLGMGSLVRASVIMWLPVALFFLIIQVFGDRKRWMSWLLACFIILLAFSAFAGGRLLQNMQAYGQPVPGQEGLRMMALGKGLSDLVRAVRIADAWDFVFLRMLRGSLWTSGWLFSGPSEDFARVYFWTLLFCLMGFLPWLVRGAVRRDWGKRAPDPLVTLCALAFGFTLFGAYLHALSSRVAYGNVLTPSYYIMPAFIPFLALALRLGQQWPGRRTWPVCAGLLGIVFLWTEADSIFTVGAPQWAQTRDAGEMMTRLSSIHPFFPSPAWMPAIALLFGFVLFLTLASARRSLIVMGRQERR